MYKLSIMVKINGIFYNMIHSMYGNNNHSHFFTCNVGVRCSHGDAISPILFNSYVSGSQSYLGFDSDALLFDTSLVNCLMYADDLALMSRTEIDLPGH